MPAATFDVDVDDLLGTVREAMAAFDSGDVSLALRDNVIEYALVEATNLFEQRLESLFEEALLGNLASARPIVAAATPVEANLLLFQSAQPEAYLSWMPFKTTTLLRANRLLEHGEPFSWASRRSSDVTILHNLTILRNFAAHRSGQARKKFDALCADQHYGQLDRASDYAIQSEQGALQIETMLTRLKLLVTALNVTTDVAANSILGPEDFYESGKYVPAGSYACLVCASTQILPTYEDLKACPTCGKSIPCPHCGKPHAQKSKWQRTPPP